MHDTLRCDDCGLERPREEMASRWITSRSSIWVCRRCRSGGWSAAASTGLGGASRYWWLFGAVAVLAFLASSDRGLPFL